MFQETFLSISIFVVTTVAVALLNLFRELSDCMLGINCLERSCATEPNILHEWVAFQTFKNILK